jgi:catechol-2,3-dioxygenase
MPTNTRDKIRVTAEDLHNGRSANSPAKLAHIVLKTPRMPEMITWYTTVLDAKVVFADRRIAFLTYDEEHHRVALIRLPRIFRLPGILWSKHRKFWGFDHAAFTYDTLEQLVATHRRLRQAGIEPVWCINHGPTTSIYYEDPDGNRIELQVDNFATNKELLDWMQSGEFDDNPIGVEFDPDVLGRKIRDHTPTTELVKRGSAPPDNRRPRAGLRTIRWKTL